MFCAERHLDDLNYVAIHRAIYTARPDVGGIVQGHTPHARAFAMGDRELEMIVQGMYLVPSLPISRPGWLPRS
jgi:ribulose-5-phosphate 4-epimerase/fuculose-1-phosphate aldolase